MQTEKMTTEAKIEYTLELSDFVKIPNKKGFLSSLKSELKSHYGSFEIIITVNKHENLFVSINEVRDIRKESHVIGIIDNHFSKWEIEHAPVVVPAHLDY